jgi:hypothetical protein
MIRTFKSHNPHLCDRCSRDLSQQNEALAHRVDIWTTASSLLASHQNFPDGDKPTPQDVLELSIFLAEENT